MQELRSSVRRRPKGKGRYKNRGDKDIIEIKEILKDAEESSGI